MKLEQSDLSLLFSSTNLPDIFFTEYLSQISGDALKVYLYMTFLAKYNKDIRLNDLSKKLELPLKTIQDSIKYLEEQTLITRKNTGYILNNIQEIELHKLYNPKVTSSPEELEKISQNKHRAKAIDSINNQFFQGIMSPSWYSDIDLWFKKYSFDEEVMIALFQYCFNRSALHRNYIQTVAEAWFKNDIKTYNDLDKYYQKQEKLNTLQKTISKKLGLTRHLSQYEEGYIEKWNIDYGYNLDVIELALKKTTSKANPNFDYLDKLLTDWHDRNFKTTNDVQNFLLQMKEKNKNIKTLEKNTGYSNYDQRNYNDLNNFYANNTKLDN
ncbi:MAG TPA: DnaD domain protein [Clostridiaceae bacterium]|jgi:DnaD/phage-associated family protein|nr:DnaD domain protein [Clostridiaceae bacterium]